MTKVTKTSFAPFCIDGETSVTISYLVKVPPSREPKIEAHYSIECNTCGHTWEYDAPPDIAAADCLPLSQLQCPNGCDFGELGGRD